jgi:hypothetical protein
MTSRLKILEIRQQELKTQCKREREGLGECINVMAKPLAWADKGLDAIYFLKKYPLLLTGIFVALTTYKPKLAGKALAVVGVVKFLKSNLS